MKIILPYVVGMLQPETKAFGREVKAQFVRVDEHGSYFALLEKLWDKGQPFLIIEQDIVGSREDVELMRSCPFPYCTAPYIGPGAQWLSRSLGFTRFRPLRLPRDLFQKIREYPDAEPFIFDDWRRIDARISQALRMDPHQHGHVEHLHEYDGLSRPAK